MTRENEEGGSGRLHGLAGVLLLVAALVYAGWMMHHTLGGVFQRGYLGHNGARYALMARNVLRYDLMTANFAPLLNAAEMADPDPYLHHPPLLQWIMALVFHVFGETEDHARMIPFVFTLLNLVLLYLLGRRILGNGLAGGITAFMAAALPVTGYYGTHIDVQGSPLVFCILACILYYLRWLDSGRKAHLRLSLGFLALGALFDWPALYLSALIPLHYWMSSRRAGGTPAEALRRTLPFMTVGCLVFLGLAVWLATAGESKGTSLLESLVARSVKPDAPEGIGSLWAFAARQLRSYCLPKVHSLYPWPFILLMILGGLLGWREGGRSWRPSERYGLWLFFLLGALHLLLFPAAGVLFHDYWAFLLMPWAALVSARALTRIAALCNDGRWKGPAIAVATGIAVAAGGAVYTMERFDMEIDPLTHHLGNRIREWVEPGRAVLTNGDYNPVMEGEGDLYTLRRPALTYYADRVVRGTIRTVEAFEDALGRRDDFQYFLFLNFAEYLEQSKALHDYLKERYPVQRQQQGLILFRLK